MKEEFIVTIDNICPTLWYWELFADAGVMKAILVYENYRGQQESQLVNQRV